MTLNTANIFCWYDLHTPDKNLARFFYETVFGWTIEDHQVGEDGAYTGLANGETSFGGMEPMPSDQLAQWVGYIGVDDFEARLTRLQGLGAQTLMDGVEVPDLGKIAILADPGHAAFAIYEPVATGDPNWMPSRGKPGDLDWAELATDDIPGAMAFYGEAFGWEFSEEEPDAMPGYQFIKHQGSPIGGIRPRPPEVPGSLWAFYGNVEDVGQSVARATALRATLLLDQNVPGRVRFALMSDPQGACFGVARGA